jgi:hypothetical protein
LYRLFGHCVSNIFCFETTEWIGFGENKGIPTFLKGMPDLEIIQFDNNNFGGILPGWIGDFAQLSVLRLREFFLSIAQCKILSTQLLTFFFLIKRSRR